MPQSQQGRPQEEDPNTRVDPFPTPEGKLHYPDFYAADTQDISGEARELLINYSHIPSEDVLPHVLRIRDEAFNVFHYACVGQLRFLNYNLKTLPFHERVISRLKSGATFLDAGCCFGQVIRHLIHTERIPSSQLYGFDLEARFIDLGFQTFRDKDALQENFVQADILAEPSALFAWDGKMDIIFCASFLHVFDLQSQLKAIEHLVRISSPRMGSVICGKQLASKTAGEYAIPARGGRHYRHSEDTMLKFWKDVGEMTRTEWKVDCAFYPGDTELRQNRGQSWTNNELGFIWFYATRTRS